MSPILWPRRVFLNAWIHRHVFERIQETLFAEPPLLSVPEFDGVFRVGTHSHLLTRLLANGHYEPVNAELCRMFVDASRDVVDVGSNIGFFTVLAAKLISGRVLAIEPANNALILLRQNIRCNAVADRVLIFEGVATNSVEPHTINVVNGKEEYSSIGVLTHPAISGAPYSSITVVSETLDHLIDLHGLNPGFIKIDVEGMEQNVLIGAANVLDKARPVILSEFSPALLRSNGVEPISVINQLRRRGYRLIDPLGPKLNLGRREYGDLLGVPEELFTERELIDAVFTAHMQVQRHEADHNAS